MTCLAPRWIALGIALIPGFPAAQEDRVSESRDEVTVTLPAADANA